MDPLSLQTPSGLVSNKHLGTGRTGITGGETNAHFLGTYNNYIRDGDMPGSAV